MDLPANIAAALMEAIIPQRTCLLKVDNDRLVDKQGIFSSARGSYNHTDLLVTSFVDILVGIKGVF